MTARLLAVLLVVAPALARAQPLEAEAPADEAARLFHEGRALVDDGKISEACARFERSFKLARELGTELNLADCNESLGHLRRALDLFEAAAIDAASDPRGSYAHDRAGALLPRLATVTVVIEHPDTPGLWLAVEGRPMVMATRVRELIEPGDVTITATAPDRIRFVRTVHAVAGEEVVVVIPDLAVARRGPSPVGDAPRRRSWVIAAQALAVVTAADIALGLYTEHAAIADQKSGRVPGGLLASNRAGAEMASAATYGLVAFGLIGAATGVYFAAPRERLTVTPVASTTAAGVAMSGHF